MVDLKELWRVDLKAIRKVDLMGFLMADPKEI
jgi:hypothetical protein